LWIIALVGSLAALIIFVLWVPLDISLDIEVGRKPRVTVRYTWFFGLVQGGRAGRGKKPRKEKPARRRRGFRRPDIGLAFKLLRSGMLSSLARLARGVLGSIRLKDLAADFRVGLGDPTDTGMLFAVIGPATALLGPSVYRRLNLQPSFDDAPCLEGYSHGAARLRPIRLLPHFFRFTFSRPTVRVARTLLAARLKRKR
jgi:hypothetical protein